MQGIIKWFNQDRGYGFIITRDPESAQTQDYFCHVNAVVDPDYMPQQFDRVTFDRDPNGKRRPAAINVQLVQLAARNESSSVAA